jgi:hypothetical protein
MIFSASFLVGIIIETFGISAPKFLNHTYADEMLQKA